MRWVGDCDGAGLRRGWQNREIILCVNRTGGAPLGERRGAAGEQVGLDFRRTLWLWLLEKETATTTRGRGCEGSKSRRPAVPTDTNGSDPVARGAPVDHRGTPPRERLGRERTSHSSRLSSICGRPSTPAGDVVGVGAPAGPVPSSDRPERGPRATGATLDSWLPATSSGLAGPRGGVWSMASAPRPRSRGFEGLPRPGELLTRGDMCRVHADRAHEGRWLDDRGGRRRGVGGGERRVELADAVPLLGR